MRKGGGHSKGAGFERQICKTLSLWVSKGQSADVYWRSAMSGGRATVQHRKGVSIRQAGDICAVAPEGHTLTEKYFIECKHVRNLDVLSFLLVNKGHLANYWKVACAQARTHKRKPMIIAKENHSPILVITHIGELLDYTSPQLTSHARNCDISLFDDMILG